MVLAIVLLCALVFVNGWTDAPNAIATCVGCGAMKMKSAVTLAAVMNFVGAAMAYIYSGKVASGIMNIVSVDAGLGKTVVCVAMFTVVVWATLAWYFGIPTSESHALVAALSGAAVAVSGRINGFEWMKVAIGLVLSVILGFSLGCIFGYIEKSLHLGDAGGKYAEIASSALMAFAHGAQDGQKFIGMFLLICAQNSIDKSKFETIALIAVAALMFFGTSMGGGRIVKSVGKDMTELTPETAFCADLSSAICVLFSTYLGVQISTTHSKTTAVMGVGTSLGKLNLKLCGNMFLAWVMTFPCCFAIGYLLCKIL